VPNWLLRHGRSKRPLGHDGFTLTELVAVMALASAVLAVTVPQVQSFLKIQRSKNAARMVEREMQSARLKAVSATRSMRVRFNCPATGQFRLLEVTGIGATDSATNRCDPAAYPSPGANDTLRSTPSMDSPVLTLPPGATVSGTVLQFEFSPQGAVSSVSTTGVVTPLASDTTITVTKEGFSRTITVNELGRVRLN
jgi:prepilin-type N-terminal cleavage/methylation domain-containing protein